MGRTFQSGAAARLRINSIRLHFQMSTRCRLARKLTQWNWTNEFTVYEAQLAKLCLHDEKVTYFCLFWTVIRREALFDFLNGDPFSDLQLLSSRVRN